MSKFSEEDCRRQGASNISDDNIGEALAAAFVDAYQPNVQESLMAKAAREITDMLSKTIPGCLTGNQALDEDVQALIFAATAARHGWEKRT